MNAQKIVFDAAAGGGNKIAGFFCPATADVAPKGIFQICHGMADYFGRYEELHMTFCPIFSAFFCLNSNSDPSMSGKKR